METEQTPAQPEEVKTPEAEIVEEPAAIPVPPRQMPKWLKFGLIGLGAVVLLFLAGFLTDHFTRFQPLNASYKAVSLQAADLEKQVSSLKGELTAANAQIIDLNSDKTGLQDDHDPDKADKDRRPAPPADLFAQHRAGQGRDQKRV